MKLLVFGNVGSGKSTLINILTKTYPWDIIAIDDYRRKYGDRSKKKEQVARKHFFEAIIPNKNQFIECIGVGKVSEDLSLFFNTINEKVVCVKLIVPKEICKSRLQNRTWDIPFPQPVEKVNQLLDRTEERINKGMIENLWNKRKNIMIISRENLQPEDINKIISAITTILKTSAHE